MKIITFVSLFFFFSCSHFHQFQSKSEKGNTEIFRTVWNKNIDPEYESGNLPIALQSPLIAEGILYVGNNSGYMQAYELKDGRLVWNEKDSSTYHSAPVLYKDQIIYGTVQGRVISRQYNTGKIKYSVDLGSSIETKGTIFNGRIFFQLRNHQIFCLDVETGKILWGYKRSVSYLTTLQRASTPIIYKDKVLVGLADGSFIALSVEEGVLIYETKLATASKFVDVDNSAFILDDKLYVGAVGSNISILEPNTGKILKRGDFLASRAPFYDTKILPDHLIFGTPSGEIIFCDKNLSIISRLKLSSGVITSFAKFKEGLVAATSVGELIYFNPVTKKIISKFSFGHTYSAIFGELESNEQHLAALSSRNRLFVFH